MIKVAIQHAAKQQCPLQDKHIESIIAAAVTPYQKEVDLTVRFVESDEIRNLNRDFRNKDVPTNVLSFPPGEMPGLDKKDLGDIVICNEIVFHEASTLSIMPEHHFTHLLVHGTLHLLGYDHITENDAQEMESHEVTILNDLNIPNPYI